MNYVWGEPNIILSVLSHSGFGEAALQYAPRIDCVARVNTDTLIQAHFPGYLRDRETWVGRPGWNSEYYRYIPDLRLRCLLVLARYAAGGTHIVSGSEVESIPVSESTGVLEAEFLTYLRKVEKKSWELLDYDANRSGATIESLPERETDLSTGLLLLRRAMQQLSGNEYPRTLEGFPGRSCTRSVNGLYVDYSSVDLWFLNPVFEAPNMDMQQDSHWMTLATKKWIADDGGTLRYSGPANVYDLRKYRRKKSNYVPRARKTATIHFPGYANWRAVEEDRQFKREVEASWDGVHPFEIRCESGRRLKRLETIKNWQEWEGTGQTYIDLPRHGRIQLWGPEGPRCPVVITPKEISKLDAELSRPRSGSCAGFGLALAKARFRYGNPGLTWSDLHRRYFCRWSRPGSRGLPDG